MIDPVEVMVALLAMQPELVTETGGRIAGRTLFGSAWEPGQTALAATLAGGKTSPNLSLFTGQFGLRFYGSDYPQAMDVWKAFMLAMPRMKRCQVTIQDGQALVYFVTAQSAPSQQWDPDLKIPLVYQVIGVSFASEVLT